MKPEFARVCALLTDTVTLLCKNGVTFATELKIQGVIGITVDKEVFVVHINEFYGENTALYNDADLQLKSDVAKISAHALVPSSSNNRARQKSKHSLKFSSSHKNVIKTEPVTKSAHENHGVPSYDRDADRDADCYDDNSVDKPPAGAEDGAFDVDGEEERRYDANSVSDIDGIKQDFDAPWARGSEEQAGGHDSWDRNVEVPTWQSYSLSAGGSATNMVSSIFFMLFIVLSFLMDLLFHCF